ncbi:MAG: hypothetical protein IT384_04270 [Deltaproteobacteria bacterium]|nr:hypothetical protein [Deltaproteobacteria bacterium]
MEPNRQSERDTTAFYQAALVGLRYLEAQKPSGRRFGPDADARWSAFRGDLTTADRIDLLLRDADAQWPSAFGARGVFAKDAVAEDEAFAPDWSPLEPIDAEKLWRATISRTPPPTPRAALEACADAWDTKITPATPTTIAAADKILLVGPSAIVATIEAFAGRSELDFCDQVVVIATPPAHRQLAAVGSALLGTTKPLRILTPSHELSAKETAAFKAHRLIHTADAHADDLAFAQRLTSARGA